MAKNFIIYIPEVGQDQAHWVMASDTGQLVGKLGEGSLSEAANSVDGRRAVVVVPGDNVLLAEATIPGGSANRAQQAVPFVLEEQVADDIDDLHFALGARSGSDRYPVAVINRETMDQLREQFAGAGLRPAEVVPETLALPKYDRQPEGEVWTALYDKGQAIVRMNGYKGFATDSGTAELMLNGARKELDEDHAAGGLVFFHTASHQVAPALPGMEVEARHCESRLSLYAAGLCNSPTINLLQGDYSLKQQFDKAWQPWRWTFGLLAVLAALFAGSGIIDYVRLGKEEARLDAEIENVFTRTFPGVPIRNPKAQMVSRIRAMGSGESTGSFIEELGRISDAISSLPNTKLNSIVFNKGRFDLDLSTDSYPSLDKLQTQLEKPGASKMSVLSANRKDGAVRARVRLEPK